METQALRVLEDLRDCRGHLANLDAGAVRELMEPVVCQESLVLRVTVALMDFLVCQETKDTEVCQVEWDPQDPPERMERGETTETSDPEVFQVNQDPVVCWVPKVQLVSPGLLACVEMMVLMVPKETWVPRESLAHLDSRVNQELRECQDLRELLDLQARRDQEENQVFQACQEPMVHQVTQERRDLLAPKETRDQVALRVLLAILALVELRENKVSVD